MMEQPQGDISPAISKTTHSVREPAPPLRSFHNLRLLRNKPCICGSGLKYKRCCGHPVTGGPVDI